MPQDGKGGSARHPFYLACRTGAARLRDNQPFRNRVKKGINNIFTQVVLVLTDKGLIALDVEYIDGTKIEIKANKSTFVWRKTVEKNRVKLQEKKRALLDQIDDSIAQDKAAETDKVDFTPEAQTSLITEL